MEKSESIKELATALSKAQGEIKPALKDSDNPFFKSKYADLASVWEVCREPLSKNGLSISQHPSLDGNAVSIETMVMHTSGEWLLSKLSMTPKDLTPQSIGSAITYARRYALSSIVGIASEIDDDGNAASQVAKAVKAVPKTPAAPVKLDVPGVQIISDPKYQQGVKELQKTFQKVQRDDDVPFTG